MQWLKAGLCTVGLLALASVSCGGTSDQGDSSGEPDSGTEDASGGSDGSQELARCPTNVLAAGDSSVEINHGGGMRRYLLHVPAGYTGESAVPLVLNFHGYTSNPEQQAAFSGMSTKADTAGFIVAYPEGLNASFNGGGCCGQARTDNVDDVGFARAVVADIQSKACVDRRRIYATGMSNGGFMTQRLACDAADLFAAVAPVAGVNGVAAADCKPSRPISMMHFHGTMDSLVPYTGGGLSASISVADSFSGWAARNGCTGDPSETFSNGSTRCMTHKSCKDGVDLTLCTTEGGGHCWPGNALCPYGVGTLDISANDEMWSFLQRYQLAE